MEYDSITLKNVSQVFIPIATRITERLDVIPKECLDELPEEELQHYETHPLIFSGKCYEFKCIYQGLINPDIKIELIYSLYEDELDDALDVTNCLDISNVVDSLMEKPFEYIANILETEKSVYVEISKIYGTTADFVVYYIDPKQEECDIPPYKYLIYKNGKYKEVKF